jgi:hypothetical protein
MNDEHKIDVVEQALKQSYVSEVPDPVIADLWQAGVMNLIREDVQRGEGNIEQTAGRLLHLSWIAAGIAAGVMLIFSLFYDSNSSGIENDFQNLYVDSSVAEFIPGEVQ